MMQQVTASAIIEYLLSNGGEICMSGTSMDFKITGGKNIGEAGPEEVSFISEKYSAVATDLLNTTKSRLVIISKSLVSKIQTQRKDQTVVLASDPKKLMVECLTKFFHQLHEVSIHPSALIDESVSKGANVSIGAFTVIDKNVVIGNNCRIENHIHIKENTVIGNDVYIKSGCVIGGKGFGFVKNEDDTWTNFPHFGKVVIGDQVEIGSNTCIDKGALGDTIIGKGTKIDNLVHIAHNVKIGENCLIIADAMLGGSVTIGENTWVAPSSSIKNGLTIGANALIGMSAVVTKNVEPGVTVVGNPAAPLIKK